MTSQLFVLKSDIHNNFALLQCQKMSILYKYKNRSLNILSEKLRKLIKLFKLYNSSCNSTFYFLLSIFECFFFNSLQYNFFSFTLCDTVYKHLFVPCNRSFFFVIFMIFFILYRFFYNAASLTMILFLQSGFLFSLTYFQYNFSSYASCIFFNAASLIMVLFLQSDI